MTMTEKIEAQEDPDAICDCYGATHPVGEGDCVLSDAEEREGYPTLTEVFERLRVLRAAGAV